MMIRSRQRRHGLLSGALMPWYPLLLLLLMLVMMSAPMAVKTSETTMPSSKTTQSHIGLWRTESWDRHLTNENATTTATTKDNESDDKWASTIHVSVAIVIVYVLILLIVMFEGVKDYAEESTRDTMRVIVDRLFGELAVFGFLATCSLLISHSPWFSWISERVLGDATALVELFDLVHFTIFFIMVFFVLQIGILMRGAIQTAREWTAWEKKARDPALAPHLSERACEYLRKDVSWKVDPQKASGRAKLQSMASLHAMGEMTRLLPVIRQTNKNLDENEILYKDLRDEFILERNTEPPFAPTPPEGRVDADFDFGRYLAIYQGQWLSQVVELSHFTWAYFAFGTLLYYIFILLVQENIRVLAWAWFALGWILYLYNVYFERHLIHVRRAFVKTEFYEPILHCRESKVKEGDGLLQTPNSSRRRPSRHHSRVNSWIADETTYLKEEEENEQQQQEENGTAVANVGSLPLWTQVDMDKYMDQRSWFLRRFVGGKPNRQQTFYWMDRYGPQFYLFILQVNLIFMGVFIALNVLKFFPYMYQRSTIPVFVLYVVFSLVPFLSVIFIKRDMVATMSQVCCIGAYRRPNIVSFVLREEKTARVVRAFVIVYKMSKFALNSKQAKLLVTQTKDKSGANSSRNLTLRSSIRASMRSDTSDSTWSAVELGEFELSVVEKAFDAFDTRHDGKIGYDEFTELMNNIGTGWEKDEIDNILNALDVDGNQEVSRQEFLKWYAHQSDQDSTPEERAKFLFQLFDENHDGSLTIGEFKHRLDALNVGFSVDEVGAIVNELDEDNNGSVSVAEFSKLIKKYYPDELKRD